MTPVWRRTPEGYAIGTSYSVLASGGPTVVGYGQGGYARWAGPSRSFDIYDGELCVGSRPKLSIAKQHAERRAGLGGPR